MDYGDSSAAERAKLGKLSNWLHNHKGSPALLELYDDEDGMRTGVEIKYQVNDEGTLFKYYFKDIAIEFSTPYLYEVWESQFSHFKKWGSVQLQIEP